jgi:endo-chitodextinase
MQLKWLNNHSHSSITCGKKNKVTFMNKLFIFLSFSLFFASYMHSQVLWYGDPDKSLSSVFYRFDAGNYPGDECPGGDGTAVSTASTTIDPVYGKVWKVSKPLNRKRGELARTSYIPAEGQTLYYGWRWKIESTPKLTAGSAVFQWKTDAGGQPGNTQNYPLNLGFGNESLSLNIYGPCYPEWDSCSGSISDGLITLWTKPVKEGEWVSIVLKLKLSRDKNVGEVELWFNGVKQSFTNTPAKRYSINLSADKKTAYHKTSDGYVNYPKWGIYNSASCPFSVNTFYDEMRIGSTLESVLDPLLTPTSTPTIKKNDLNIFPNPSKNGLFNFSESTYFEVFNLQGQQIFSNNGRVLNLSTYPSGVYLLKTKSGYLKLIKN